MRTPLLIVVVPMLLFFFAVVLFHRLDSWSVAAAALAASAVTLVITVRDDAPHHVVKWGRGAEGERRTEKVLKPLEREGWTVEHDIDRPGRANIDHVVIGPPGVFLLETKCPSGFVSIEDGVMTTRQFDDPEEVFRNARLAGRVRGQAKELSQRLYAETGRRTWVAAAVVIWGEFDQGLVSGENITYLHGDGLVAWLKSHPS